MTEKEIAEIMANELIDDMDRLGETFEKFYDRWIKYGQQFSHLISPATLARIEEAHAKFVAKMNRCGGEEET